MVNEMAFTTRSAAETQRLGRQLGALMKAGDVIFLTGDLGAGKTTFAKGVALGLGIREDVTSPTFTLVTEYEGRVPLAHMDLYRLLPEQGATAANGDGTGDTGASVDGTGSGGSVGSGSSVASGGGVASGSSLGSGGGVGSSGGTDFASIGVEDYLYGDYAVLVEWPGDLVHEVDDALHIHIVQQPLPRIDEREFQCKATGERSWKRLDEWVKQWLF
nr:tRNA (adenosine(37)-N6)-threonylcarbamoyltransferase complex ATPase subunit type 1 TsaE [Alicyclobacillus ferrooxydans]